VSERVKRRLLAMYTSQQWLSDLL